MNHCIPFTKVRVQRRTARAFMHHFNGYDGWKRRLKRKGQAEERKIFVLDSPVDCSRKSTWKACGFAAGTFGARAKDLFGGVGDCPGT